MSHDKNGYICCPGWMDGMKDIADSPLTKGKARRVSALVQFFNLFNLRAFERFLCQFSETPTLQLTTHKKFLSLFLSMAGLPTFAREFSSLPLT